MSEHLRQLLARQQVVKVKPRRGWSDEAGPMAFGIVVGVLVGMILVLFAMRFADLMARWGW